MYGYYYLMFATFPELFPQNYGFSTGLAGLVSDRLSCLTLSLINSLRRHIWDRGLVSAPLRGTVRT